MPLFESLRVTTVKEVRTMEVTQLVEQCRQGLPEAWKTLVSMFSAPALNWVTQFCRDPDLAEDVVQESWLIAARHLSELRNPQAFPRWFFQIVKTQAYRALMREYRQQAGEMREVAIGADQERSTALKLDLERALESLPLELKQVFVLAGIYQWPIRDVASFLQIPAGTVKSRLSRARQHLQAALKEDGGVDAGHEHTTASLDNVLSALGTGAEVNPQTVCDTLARAWATMKSLRFTLTREWPSSGQPDRRQRARYTWRAPNWLRWYVGLVLIGVSIGPGIVHRGSVDHWLAFPFPRWQLVLAKWLAIVWSGLKWLLGVTALAAVVGAWAWHVHPDLTMGGRDAAALFLRGFALSLAVLPAASAFTLLSLAFQSGWGRWFWWVAPVPQWGVLAWAMFEGLGSGTGGSAQWIWQHRWIEAGTIWVLGLASLFLVCVRLPSLASWRGNGVADGSIRRGRLWWQGSAKKRMQNEAPGAPSRTPGELGSSLDRTGDRAANPGLAVACCTLSSARSMVWRYGQSSDVGGGRPGADRSGCGRMVPARPAGGEGPRHSYRIGQRPVNVGISRPHAPYTA